MLCSRQDRTSALILFKASLLIAGPNPVNTRPFLVRMPRARKVNPRKSNDVCSAEPRRIASLQYTSRVLSGCRLRPTCFIRSSSAARIIRACFSERQCTTASSTYRSNGTDGNFRASHISNA